MQITAKTAAGNNRIEYANNIMSKVKFPKFAITLGKDSSKAPWSSSSLLAYLGFRNKGREFSDSLDFVHKFNAIPQIAYFDIFKNYYANKQEENFYTIGLGQTLKLNDISPNIVTGKQIGRAHV